MMYKVIKDYTDVPESPIRVTKGEVLQFIEESDPDGDWANWIFCKGMGKEGWIPKQILSVREGKATVLKDYVAKEHTLTVGETLISEHELNGWIWCRKSGESDALAWAPLNHLVKV